MEGKSGLSGKAVFLINAFSGAFLVSRTVKNLPTMLETLVQSVVRKMPWRKEWLPIPVFLPGEFHGQRRLVSYSPWGHKESDTPGLLNTTTTTTTSSLYIVRDTLIFVMTELFSGCFDVVNCTALFLFFNFFYYMKDF